LSALTGTQKWSALKCNALQCLTTDLIVKEHVFRTVAGSEKRKPGSRFLETAKRVVEPDGIEPTTSCLQSRRSPN
jgi:hypothetical protein